MQWTLLHQAFSLSFVPTRFSKGGVPVSCAIKMMLGAITCFLFHPSRTSFGRKHTFPRKTVTSSTKWTGCFSCWFCHNLQFTTIPKLLVISLPKSCSMNWLVDQNCIKWILLNSIQVEPILPTARSKIMYIRITSKIG